MATVKTPNYTDEMVKEMVSVYGAATDADSRSKAVAMLADKFGKSVASIRAKLTREKVYVKKVYKTKAGGNVVAKGEMVVEIAHLCDVAPELFDSLEKVNKSVLSTIIYKLEKAAEKG